MSWKHQLNYIFPPFSLIGHVLQNLTLQEAEAVIVALLWTTQAWFARALMLLVADPYLLPKDSLTMPQDP